jgi:hypothetical protein
VRAFCRREGLSEPSFYGWKRTIAERDKEASARKPARPGKKHRKSSARQSHGSATGDDQGMFVPVTVMDQLVAETSLEIVAPGGWRVRVQRGFDAKMLTDVLDALQAAGHSGVAGEGREVA